MSDNDEPDEPTEVQQAERDAVFTAMYAEWKRERAARAKQAEQEDCPHSEHDHGICLYCHKDIWDDLVGKAEAWADAKEDR